MTPKRTIVNLFKYVAQLLPSNRLRLCGTQEKQELTKKSGTYPKKADPTTILKETLAYPERYMIQTLLGDLTDAQGDKNTSAEIEFRD